MAARNSKARKFDITNVVGAVAGGAITGVATDLIDEAIVKKNPKWEQYDWVLPSGFEILGGIISHFGGDQMKGIGYGMMGAASSDLARVAANAIEAGKEDSGEEDEDNKMNGSTSRVDESMGMSKVRARLEEIEKQRTGTPTCEEVTEVEQTIVEDADADDYRDNHLNNLSAVDSAISNDGM